ncbi:MAG TPA: AsmA-like C-terminal domain-containing protein, partial [Pirellulales bacterium]|nr:AsmA-like C-terminal domain-containing protein [Pirellulales bacterium]
GDFDGRRFRCQGDVNFDSLAFKDAQFTEVMGPFWIDDTQLLVGMWADRLRQVQPERRITSKLYGGALVADGWMIFGAQPRYSFQATATQADLTRVTQELIPGRQPLSGDIRASLELRGKGASINDLAGRGTIQLRHADIYQLPLMVSLLKLLSVRPPDTTAFTASDIDFYIQSEHIYIDRIDFSGDAVSLLGKGEINFNRQLHLTFHAMVGPNRRRIPLVGDLLGGASQQIMLIHADGSLDQPALRREAFPGVNQAWQQLQAELYPREPVARRPESTPAAIPSQ